MPTSGLLAKFWIFLSPRALFTNFLRKKLLCLPGVLITSPVHFLWNFHQNHLILLLRSVQPHTVMLLNDDSFQPSSGNDGPSDVREHFLSRMISSTGTRVQMSQCIFDDDYEWASLSTATKLSERNNQQV